ncbi:MAG: hypothetical protein H7X93_03420 [Sphingomonadaceae bacterium]|nr:hypothetical protein [Sphingomonadaceae bacterium]
MSSKRAAAIAMAVAVVGCSPSGARDSGDDDDGFIGSAGSDGGRTASRDGDEGAGGGARHHLSDSEGQLNQEDGARLEAHLAGIREELGADIHVATRGDNASYENPDCRPESSDQSCAEALLVESDAVVIILADLASGDVVIVPSTQAGDRFAGGYLDEVIARMGQSYQSGGNIAALITAADGVADAWRDEGNAGEQGYSEEPVK